MLLLPKCWNLLSKCGDFSFFPLKIWRISGHFSPKKTSEEFTMPQKKKEKKPVWIRQKENAASGDWNIAKSFHFRIFSF